MSFKIIVLNICTHMSGWFFLNLPGTESRLISAMLSETGTQKQVQ